MVWQMLGIKRVLKAANRRWRLARETWHFRTWDVIYFTRVHSWAGHVARLETTQPQRLCARLFRWRGAQ
eukprot:425900-Amphidinium_carterae.2